MSGFDPGPLLSALAAVLVLGGGLTALIVGAIRAKPGELMTENGRLRGEIREVDESLSKLRDDFDGYKSEQRRLAEERDRERARDHRRIGVLVDGVNTMWQCLEQLTTMLRSAGQSPPEWSDTVRQAMQAARDAAQDGA